MAFYDLSCDIFSYYLLVLFCLVVHLLTFS